MPHYAPPRALIAALAATLLLSAAAVQAADKKKISPAERKLAHRHFELASTYYQQAAYDEALKYFDKSYQLSGEPALLFNIGKCHEALGQLQKAIVSYQAYLKATGGNPTVEARIRNLSSRLPKKKPASAPKAAPAPAHKPDEPPPSKNVAAAPAPAKATRPAATPTPRASPPSSNSDSGGRTWSWWTGWALAGVGLAAVGASIAFGVLAKNKADTVNSYYLDGNRDWSEVQSIEDQGKSFQTAQIVTLAAGIGLAAGGAALLLFLPRRSSAANDKASRDKRSDFALAPVIGGGVYGVAGALRF